MKAPLMTCPKCQGTGMVMDPIAAGMKMRSLRLKEKISLREIARRMGLSAPYVSDMERGRRSCEGKILEYLEAFKNP